MEPGPTQFRAASGDCAASDAQGLAERRHGGGGHDGGGGGSAASSRNFDCSEYPYRNRAAVDAVRNGLKEEIAA